MHKRYAWILIALLLLPLLAAAQETNPTTVILVRHAEKQSDTDNPDLSLDGQIRAQQLIHILGSSEIRGVYTTQYMRTQKTAAPLAAFLKVTPVEIDAAKTDELIKHIFANHKGEVVFVAGHSNTVPEIIAALGAKIPPVEDWEYDNLYIVTVTTPGKATVLRLKYGEVTK